MCVREGEFHLDGLWTEMLVSVKVFAETVPVSDAFDEFLCVTCSSINVQQRAAESKTVFTRVGVSVNWNVFFYYYLFSF